MHSRNVTISGRRTSLKLEPDMWEALEEVCTREGRTLHEVCTMIARRHAGGNLTAAVRVFILAYFRAAATEEGHRRAGHGEGEGGGADGEERAVERLAQAG